MGIIMLMPYFFHLLVISIVLCIWLRYKFTYWKARGLHSPSFSYILKNMKMAFFQQNSFAERDMNIYQYFKADNLKHGGIYFLILPMYVPVDLEIIKYVLQIDHSYFLDRGIYMNEKGDPLSAHLFSLGGQKWKHLRKKVTPTFTSGKMKMMFDTFLYCTVGLRKVMDDSLGSAVNIKDIMGRFTIDIIGNCAFGLNCNSLEDPNSEFKIRGQDIFHRSFTENMKQVFLYAFPELSRFLNIKMLHKEVSDFFMYVIKSTITYRENNDIHRKDFMHLLIQLKNTGYLSDDRILKTEDEAKDTLSLDEIAAQAFVFFEAGFETSSSTMAFCLYELALNLDIQEKLRREIIQVLQKHGSVTYEAVGEMKYLEKVINETLRKYPPLSSLYRVCTKEYKIPGSDVILEKGTRVMIPIYGIHHDAEYYPEPEVFNPERFSDENKCNIPDFSYLPFGNGPRNCIGMRFGLLQIKVGVITLIKNYEFRVSPKTSKPLEFDPESLTLTTKGELWLDYQRLS